MRLHGTSAIRNVLDRLAVLSKISPPCFYHRDAIGKERTDVTKNLKEVPFFEKILDQQFFYLHVEIVESPRNSKRKEKWRHHQKNPFFSFLFSSYICLFFIIIVVVLGRCVCWMRAFVYIYFYDGIPCHHRQTTGRKGKEKEGTHKNENKRQTKKKMNDPNAMELLLTTSKGSG